MSEPRIVITPGPPAGYHEAGNAAALLVCNECGSLVVDLATHTRWHEQQRQAIITAIREWLDRNETTSPESEEQK